MQIASITIINKLGLHARAAAKLVGLASRYSSEVIICKQEKTANGKSIMGVMMLAAKMGSEITLSVEGSDEIEALREITALIENKFGESE